MGPEATLQAAVIRLLKKRGVWYAKVHQTGRGRRGIPDLLCCHRGRFIALELKAPGKHPTAFQEVELGAVKAAGGQAHVIHALSELTALLTNIDISAARAKGYPGMSPVHGIQFPYAQLGEPMRRKS